MPKSPSTTTLRFASESTTVGAAPGQPKSPPAYLRLASDVVNDVLNDASSQTQLSAKRRPTAAGYPSYEACCVNRDLRQRRGCWTELGPASLGRTAVHVRTTSYPVGSREEPAPISRIRGREAGRMGPIFFTALKPWGGPVHDPSRFVASGVVDRRRVELSGHALRAAPSGTTPSVK